MIEMKTEKHWNHSASKTLELFNLLWPLELLADADAAVVEFFKRIFKNTSIPKRRESNSALKYGPVHANYHLMV